MTGSSVAQSRSDEVIAGAQSRVVVLWRVDAGLVVQGSDEVDDVHGIEVGFGRIVDRPWAVDGLLGVRPLVRATLAADHRASDGHDGGRFLAAVDRLLQRPEEL